MFEPFVNLLLSFSTGMGYWGVALLMVVESSFIPFPSEVVIPPAAYLASQGVMNIYLVVIVGIVGSLIGASINYYLAMTLGRRVVYKLVNHRFAKFFFINDFKMKKSENFFLKYGRVSTLTGRLVPVVRQLISIPAGFSRMNFASFIVYTFIGSGIWTVILAVLGYTCGSNLNVLSEYYSWIKIGMFLLISTIVIGFVIRFIMKRNYASSEEKKKNYGVKNKLEGSPADTRDDKIN